MKFTPTAFVILMIIICGGIKAFAQTPFQENKPGINAQQFITAAQSGNNLSVGQPSINIPLFNLPARGINIPISISFSGVGITSESNASSVGLGWSLLAGGVITQTIRDINDKNANGEIMQKSWIDNSNYLQSLASTQQNNPYDRAIFEQAMYPLMQNGGVDLFNYAFLGYSGKIRFDHNLNPTKAVLYPDKSFKMNLTTNGYRIIANDGTEYIFEDRASANDANVSWFLSKIKTTIGGEVIFHYEDESYYDYQNRKFDGTYGVGVTKSISRIDYDGGYVIFGGPGYTIEMYDLNNHLIKGYKFKHTAFVTNGIGAAPGSSSIDRRPRLDGIEEYAADGKTLPPYLFQYDYLLGLNQAGDSPGGGAAPTIQGGWAKSFAANAFVDRTDGGMNFPHVEYEQAYDPSTNRYFSIPRVSGFSTSVDETSGFTGNDYLCLTNIQYPSGGYETFLYEPHSYRISRADPEPNSGYFVPNNRIIGRRMYQKVTGNNMGSSQVAKYNYILHDDDYKISQTTNSPTLSSGILTNPSVYSSTVYTPNFDPNSPRLEASIYKTQRPQNSFNGSPIYYTEVEESFAQGNETSNGKNIYYYEKMYSEPPENFVYLNYNIFSSGQRSNNLISIPNTIYGKQFYPPQLVNLGFSSQNFTYMAYPVGSFYHSDILRGELNKIVTLNKDGKVVKIVEYLYTPGGENNATQYSYTVKRYEDFGGGDFTHYRFLISKSTEKFGVRKIVSTTTTNYYANEAVTEKEDFQYGSNDALKSTTVTLSKGGSKTSEIVYANELNFQTQSNLSLNAAAIKIMMEKNMVAIPVQTTVKNGDKYIGGNFNTFKQLSTGAVVIDSAFYLDSYAGNSITNPTIDLQGIVKKSNFFIPGSITQYDSYGNIQEQQQEKGIKVVYLWGYSHKYPVAKIIGSNYATVSNISTISQSQIDALTTSGNDDDLRTLLNNLRVYFSANPTVQITTYTYKPLVGITSTTDPRGQTTYQEYDNFNRLHIIRNSKKKIVQEICYNYAGEAGGCYVKIATNQTTSQTTRLAKRSITQPTPPTTPALQTLYARVEFDNVETATNANIKSYLSDIYIRFYSDQACTVPLHINSSFDIKLNDHYTAQYVENPPNENNQYTYTIIVGSPDIFLGRQYVRNKMLYADPVYGETFDDLHVFSLVPMLLSGNYVLMIMPNVRDHYVTD